MYLFLNTIQHLRSMFSSTQSLSCLTYAVSFPPPIPVMSYLRGIFSSTQSLSCLTYAVSFPPPSPCHVLITLYNFLHPVLEICLTYATSFLLPGVNHVLLMQNLFIHSVSYRMLLMHFFHIRGSLNKFPDFFRMGTFIDSTHMKL